MLYIYLADKDEYTYACVHIYIHVYVHICITFKFLSQSLFLDFYTKCHSI